MTDQFKSIVNHFLSSDIEFTLMVNGDWGSGKTYYFKSDQFLKDSGKKVVYTSVFGLKDLKEIDDAIVYQKLRLNGNFGKVATSKNVKVIASIGKTIGKGLLKQWAGLEEDDFDTISNSLDEASNLSLSDTISMSDDEVLIIDDIERLDSSISYDDFFGYVSSNYSEGSGIKVILVCKEDEIAERFNKKIVKRYNKIKEKTVWKTINFNLNLDKILPSFYNKESYKGAFKKYLVSNHKHLISLCKEFKINNLRTLRFFFENLKRPFEVNAGFFEITDKEKIVFESILILSDHYKNGISLIDENGRYKSYLIDKFRGHSELLESDDIPNSDSDTNYIKEKNEFNTRYFSRQGGSYHALLFIISLIRKGYFDKDLFDKEIIPLETYYKQKEEWHIALYRFNNPIISSNDKEYQDLQSKVINYVKEGKYDYDQLMSLVNNYIIWSKEGIKFIVNEKELESIISNAFTDKIDYDLSIAAFPVESTAIQNDYPKYYFNLLNKGEIRRNLKWQEEQQKYIDKELSKIQGTSDFNEDSLCKILNSHKPEDFTNLVAAITSNVQSMRSIESCHMRLISKFMMDNSQARIDKLKHLAKSIEQATIKDSIKSYVFKKFKDSFYKTIDRYIPQVK
jgi:hypothetical protein